MEKYSATLGLQPKKSVEFLGAEFVGDCKRINRTLATRTLSRYVLRQNHCQWVTNVPRHTTKPQTLRFSSHRSLFLTFPDQLSMLHHACESTHPEPMSQDRPQNLRPQDFHLTHPCFEFCRNRSPYYTPHLWQPILNQCPKTHHKTSDPKIFISHIPVLNFAGADLHIIPHICGNPSRTNVPRHTTKPQTPRFSSHTSLFWTLPEQISILYPTCVPTLNQCPKTHHKTSDPKIFISQIPVLNFAGADLHIIPHMCANPSWTNVPRHTTKPQIQDFHLTHPCFELCRNRSRISIFCPTCVPTHLEPMSQDTPQNLRPQDFHLTHPCFELCQNRCRVWAPRSSKLIPWLFVDMIARVKNVKRKQGSSVPQRIEFNPRDPFFSYVWLEQPECLDVSTGSA